MIPTSVRPAQLREPIMRASAQKAAGPEREHREKERHAHEVAIAVAERQSAEALQGAQDNAADERAEHIAEAAQHHDGEAVEEIGGAARRPELKRRADQDAAHARASRAQRESQHLHATDVDAKRRRGGGVCGARTEIAAESGA